MTDSAPPIDPDLDIDRVLSADARALLVERVRAEAVAKTKTTFLWWLGLGSTVATLLGWQANRAVSTLRTQADSLRTAATALQRQVGEYEARLPTLESDYQRRIDRITADADAKRRELDNEMNESRLGRDALSRQLGETDRSARDLLARMASDLGVSDSLRRALARGVGDSLVVFRSASGELRRRVDDVDSLANALREHAFDTGFFPVLEEQTYVFPDADWHLAIRFENADRERIQQVCAYAGTDAGLRHPLDLKRCSGDVRGYRRQDVLPKNGGAMTVNDGTWEYVIELHNVLKIFTIHSDVAVFHVERHRLRAESASSHQAR